ncbi:MAG: hypothetical protein WCK96_14615 [Methylococcales bacterium]
MISFTDDLAITLSLTIAGQSYNIPAGDVKSLELSLHPYGFNGKISFVVTVEGTTDKLFTPITTKNDLIELSLQVVSYLKPSKTTSIPLVLSGLVTTRGFTEQTLTNVLPSQTLMLCRHYHLTFADPAQVLWKQHYPCDLLTDSSLKTLITAHASAKINLTYDWSVLETVYPVLSLSLGASSNQASFYDFLLWLVDSQNGVFSYDITTNQYSLTASKSQTGTAKSLDAFEITKFGIDFPEVLRHQPNVLNAYSESPKITAITNEQVAVPIRHDYIARYPIAADMQARVDLETARFKQCSHEVWVEYQKFQLQVTPPGQLVNFQGSSAWNSSLFNQANIYRVRKWQLHALWTKQGDVPGYSCYEIQQSMRLESSTELWVDLPSYTLPVYPFFVEGKIVSETGEDTDATYQFYTDENTSINYYQISIPLWDNKKVRAAYQPNLDAGQFYFPPYKNARVLVGLNFNSAVIADFLDWGSGTALPMDSQGNQLVMGKSTTSHNIIKHTYVDSKPELQIQRTEKKDTELLQFSDGYIILQTQTEE